MFEILKAPTAEQAPARGSLRVGEFKISNIFG
jgi:hypothetical protein